MCRLYLLYETFVRYFPSRHCVLVCRGVGATQRLRDSSVCHHCPSVPCVLCLAPPRLPPPASPLWLMGGPPPAQQVSHWPLPHGASPPGRHNFLGVRDCRTRSEVAFCHLSGAMTGPSVSPSPVASRDLLCSPASRWGGPANRRNRFLPVPSLNPPSSPARGGAPDFRH